MTHREIADQQPLQPLGDFPAGLLHGYGVYTTFRWPIARPWLDAHLERLRADAASLGLQWPVPNEAIKERLASEFDPERPVMRLSVVADTDGYGDLFRQQSLPARLILSDRPVSPPSENPIRLQSVRHCRPLAGIKHGAMADVVHFRRQARQAGFDEVLLVSETDVIREAGTANAFFLDTKGTLWTPDPARDACLPGITRLQVLEAAARLQIPVRTDMPVTLDRLADMRAAFLSNAVQGILPVGRIDGHEFVPSPEADSLVDAVRRDVLRQNNG